MDENELSKIETVAHGHGVSVGRTAVPGGWLYVTRTVAQAGYGAQSGTVSIATAFVPDPSAGSSR